MKKLMIVGMMVIGAAMAFAEEAKPDLKSMTPEQRKAYREKHVMERTGGYVNVKGTPAGQIVIVNAQKKVTPDNLDIGMQKSTFKGLASITKMVTDDYDHTKCLGMQMEGFKAKYKADFLMIVVDNPQLPPSIVAVEAKWAIMNVAALEKGAATPEVTRIRARNEFARVYAMLCGGFSSQFKAPLTNYVKEVSDLDNCLYDLPIDMGQKIFGYLNYCGVKPEKKVPYRKAVQEGWAAAPTNEFQKAIWKEVHDKIEKGPANALKIVPPKK